MMFINLKCRTLSLESPGGEVFVVYTVALQQVTIICTIFHLSTMTLNLESDTGSILIPHKYSDANNENLINLNIAVNLTHKNSSSKGTNCTAHQKERKAKQKPKNKGKQSNKQAIARHDDHANLQGTYM